MSKGGSESAIPGSKNCSENRIPSDGKLVSIRELTKKACLGGIRSAVIKC